MRKRGKMIGIGGLKRQKVRVKLSKKSVEIDKSEREIGGPVNRENKVRKIST